MNRRGRWALVLVLLLVNGAAVWGQAGWALEHIVPVGWIFWAGLSLALAFAAAIELIGVFLALSADDAEDRGIPSGGIRLSSYAVGILSGALNFSHWSNDSVAAAIAFGLLSAISPFLWGINSRVNRARPIAPSRRFWHPRRSISLIRHMAWEGIALESEGIESMKPTLKLTPYEPLQVNAPQGSNGHVVTPELLAELEQGPIPERRQRAGKPEQEEAVRLMLAGQSTAVLERGLMSRATLGTYQSVHRKLRDDPQAEVGDKHAGRTVRPELVAIIRDHANRGRAL